MFVAVVAACLAAVVYAGTNAAGLKYLADNKGKDGVIETASGLQVRGCGWFVDGWPNVPLDAVIATCARTCSFLLLQYKVLKKGEGKFHPTVDSPCSCHVRTAFSAHLFGCRTCACAWACAWACACACACMNMCGVYLY